MLNPDYIDIKLRDIYGMRDLVREKIMPYLNWTPKCHEIQAERTITMILGNMFVQWCQDRALSFCKDRKAYQKDKIGNPPPWYMPTYVTRCFEELEFLGAIATKTLRTGYQNIPSKAYPTEGLIREIFEKITFPPPVFEKDLVVLRGPKIRKKTINSKTKKTEYRWVKGAKQKVWPYTPFAKENIDFIKALNSHIGQAVVIARKTTDKFSAVNILVYAHLRSRIVSDIRSPKGIKKQIMGKPLDWEFQLMDLNMFRSFNEDYTHGGRIYGSIHEELPKEIRRSIKIDGEETVELDYSGLHIRMLYHQKGIDYREDPYNLGDIPRELVKRPVLAMINAKGEFSARKSIFQFLITDEDDAGREYRKKDYRRNVWKLTLKLIQAFKDKHEDIAGDLFSGVGLKLQFQDSEIMKAILKKLMKLGVICLPVHDSILCKKRQRRIVKRFMIDEYKNFFDFSPIISH